MDASAAPKRIQKRFQNCKFAGEGHFDVLGSFWIGFGTILVAFWHPFATFWSPFGTFLVASLNLTFSFYETFQPPSERTSGHVFGRFPIDMEPILSHFGQPLA